MLNKRLPLLAGCACLVLALVIVWLKTRPAGREAVQVPTSQSPQPTKPAGGMPGPGAGAPTSPERAEQPAQSASTEPASREAVDKILDDLQAAAVTYDASQLPVIEPFLLDPNPEIRTAAINAMITLGDASAGPLLRKAAGQLDSPRDAVAMLEAADYVELPPAKFKLKKRSGEARNTQRRPVRPGTARPGPQPPAETPAEAPGTAE